MLISTPEFPIFSRMNCKNRTLLDPIHNENIIFLIGLYGNGISYLVPICLTNFFNFDILFLSSQTHKKLVMICVIKAASRLCDPFSWATTEKHAECRLRYVVNLIWNKFSFDIHSVTRNRGFFSIKGVFIWVDQFRTLDLNVNIQRAYTHTHRARYYRSHHNFTKYSIFPCDCVVC